MVIVSFLACVSILGLLMVVAVQVLAFENRNQASSFDLWFGRAGSCAVTGKTTDCSNSALDFSFGRPFTALPANKDDGGDNWNNFDGQCCESDMPIQARGFLNSSHGLIDPNHKPIINLLTRLSENNGTVLFVGDSVMAQTNYAFVAELRRECLIHGLPMPESMVEREKKHFALHSSHPDRISALFRWSNVMIVFTPLVDENYAPVEEFISDFARVYSTSVTLVGNFGLRLAETAKRIGKPGEQGVYELLDGFVLWMARLKKTGRHLPVLMETTATHFNAPLGYHELREAPLDSKHQEFPQYQCRPHSESEAGSNRLENLLLYDILQRHSLTHVVPVIEVHAHFAPHYRMHYGSCAASAAQRNYSSAFSSNTHRGARTEEDCVHLCAYSPLMWAPIWHQMDHRIHAVPPLPREDDH